MSSAGADEETLRNYISRLQLYQSRGHIYANKKPTPEDIEFIRAHSQEFIDLLKRIDEEERRSREESEKARYAQLEARLPPFIPPESDGNEAEAKRLLKEAKNLKYYHGEEDDGLNLAVSAGKSRLEKEAAKHCNHEWEERIHRTCTEDARKRIERTVRCRKCGWSKTDSVEDRVDREAMWR